MSCFVGPRFMGNGCYPAPAMPFGYGYQRRVFCPPVVRTPIYPRPCFSSFYNPVPRVCTPMYRPSYYNSVITPGTPVGGLVSGLVKAAVVGAILAS